MFKQLSLFWIYRLTQADRNQTARVLRGLERHHTIESDTMCHFRQILDTDDIEVLFDLLGLKQVGLSNPTVDIAFSKD